jgi:hypothetical protein
MSATAVDKLLRPELVAGGIRRIVAELNPRLRRRSCWKTTGPSS